MFKAGDMVRCTDDSGWGALFKEGNIYEVLDVEISSYVLRSEVGDRSVWKENWGDFELEKGGKKMKEQEKKYLIVTKSCRNIDQRQLYTKDEVLRIGCKEGQYILDVSQAPKLKIKSSLVKERIVKVKKRKYKKRK